MNVVYKYKNKVLTDKGSFLKFPKEEFNPMNIEGGQLWLDAADESTFYKDVMNRIETWYDKGPNGWHLSQGTYSNKPEWKPNAQNNNGVVWFDGINDALKNYDINLSQPLTIFVALDLENDGEQRYIFDGIEKRIALAQQGFNDSFIYAGDVLFTGELISGKNIIKGIFNSAESSIRINNGVMHNANVGVNNLTDLALGTHIKNGMKGNFYEMIVYNRVLSTDEELDITNYLSDKWSITL